MKHGLPKIITLIVLSTGMVGGCVSQSTYSGTDVPVSERPFDNVLAAQKRAQLGLTYLRRGNSQQAKYNLDKAIKFAPNIEDVHISMAYYYQTVGDLDNAEKSYRKAINASDASGDGFNNFGVFLCQQDKFKESEKMFLRAVKMPKYTRAGDSYENLGICSRKAGEINKAREYFSIALKYNPRSQSTLIELTEIEIEQDNYLDARAQLARYHRIIAQSAESLILGVTIERALNDEDEARRFGILLLAKFPSSNEAKRYRASMH
ncbi:type IV pilus biogenesis/stability protein PilW [Shewanella hanedai]|jgi:type IV pilus assembly protein PilF|uniref:Type IV pilus biogenesis/stability protein PilW n=1 Tax=Shewanella hanedai TaxID=25 RepID=A0A553JSY3_SHEHA|nr:type IV pilus biogenesis/stability protein PilW [Shewanella hanedai]TRY15558.1 type IV pilus biogenesis/stability protein PilW [Shewanella hanedai]GGI72562.1 type IV pilus biogenesis/stability protein PilW [Shewanella hanedai]